MHTFKKYVFLLFFFISVTYVNAQKEAAKWCLNGGAVLNFMTTPTSVNFNSNPTYDGLGPSMCDAAGNLLFYYGSAGAIPYCLFNRLDQQMPNGVYGLGGNTQSFFVKQPGNTNIYYHFLTWDYPTSAGTLMQRYAIIDMNLAAGMGSVTAKDLPLNTSSSARLAGVKHCNGNDVWILTRDSVGSLFKAYLLTAAGINSPVISASGTSTMSSLGQHYRMKFSPNGKKLCVVGQVPASVELFDFDNTTGMVSNRSVLAQFPATMLYCEFSPDGTKLYVGKGNGGIFQWDLCAGSNTAVVASQYSIASVGTGDQQLGIDGKIYVARSAVGLTSFYGVINNSNVAGAGCNYTDFGISVAPRFAYDFSQDFISSYFVQKPQQAPFTFTLNPQPYCNSVAFTAPASQTVMGCAASGFTLLGTAWEFGDPASGVANVSTLTNPVHIYSAPGTYTPKLIFYYSCGGGTDTLKQTVTIVSPTVAISTTSITCANLGSATVTAGGGIGPYTYTWQPVAQTGSAATGLIPGNYTVTLFDVGSSCLANYTAYLAPLIPLTGNISNSSGLTCPGAANGTANVTGIAGGSGAQTYLWYNGSLTYTSAFANSLSAGLWSVTVTDALTGCQINQSFFITQPQAFNLNLSSNTPTTCAGTNIVLTGTNSGGTPFASGPGYTYTWSTAPPGNTASVSQATAGTYIYSLSSSDANNCLTSNTISVDFIANPVLVVSNVSICPLTVGTLTVSGASSYTWSSTSTTLSVTPGSSFTDSPVSSGQYTVVGTSQSCTSAATADISVMPLPSPFLTSNSPRCEGSSLFLNAVGGASYAWSGPNGFNSASANNNFNALSLTDAGVYNVTVTAANSCTAAATKTLVVNPIPTLSATGSTVCTSQTLNLNAVSTATTFVWSGPLSFTSNVQNPFITNPLVTNTGTYTVKATSAFGCTNTAIAIASVVIPPSLTAQLSSYSLCSQAFNGSPNTITLTAGGANTYTLVTVPDMFNANPTGPISPLMAIPPNTGAASATLSGSNGVCTVTTGLTFSIIPNPSVTVSSPTPVICAGDTYTYTSQGAGSYSWSSATPGFTTYNNGGVAVASPSIHSVFSVFGASLGCNSASETSTITVNPLPLISLLPTSPTVCIGSKVNLMATGSSNSYTWSPYLNINSIYGSTVNASPNIQQTYTVIGSLNSCTSTAMITVSVLTLPSPIAAVLKPTVCLNETITLQGFGGETYQWYGPNSIYYEGQTVNLTANSYIYAGIYTLTVADKNNCKASALTSVTINSLPDGSLLGTQMQGCVPFKSYFNYYSALATSTNIATQWTVDQKVVLGKSFSKDFTIPGNHTIIGNFRDTLTNCLNTQTFVVEAYPVPLADFSYLPEKPIENLDEVIFTNTSKGEEQKKWDWFFVNNQGYRSQNKNTEYLFTEAGLYPIAMIVTNTWGCADTVVKSLKIESDLTVYVPNVFTPNGDDLNEVFLPIVRAIKSYEFLVFDRWGSKVFSTTNTEVGWDGTYRGEPCKMDVYVWKINLSSVNGEMKTMTGSVVLSR